MNNKGEVKVSTIIIGCIMFLVFLTAGLSMTYSFFSYETNLNDSSFNSSYFDDVQDSRMDQTGSNVDLFMEATTGMSNNIFYENGSVSDSISSTAEDTMNKNTLKTITELPKIYTFAQRVFEDLNQKLGVPWYVIGGIFSILIVSVLIGYLSLHISRE